CSRCARPVAAGRRYRVRNGEQHESRCLRCALPHAPMIRRAVSVAAVVGTILTAINQGDLLLAGQLTWGGLVKIVLTYMVPFCVSVYSVLAMNRERVGDA
ncbi:MAG: nitrate/nitrite transporter NrtS, partial [Candidatus Rokuibacteriota bacterium]